MEVFVLRVGTWNYRNLEALVTHICSIKPPLLEHPQPSLCPAVETVSHTVWNRQVTSFKQASFSVKTSIWQFIKTSNLSRDQCVARKERLVHMTWSMFTPHSETSTVPSSFTLSSLSTPLLH